MPTIPLAFLGPIGAPELLVILVIGLLLFGSRLPEVGRSLGRGMLEFKRGLRGMQDEIKDVDDDADRRIDAELRRNEPLPKPAPPSDASGDVEAAHAAPPGERAAPPRGE